MPSHQIDRPPKFYWDSATFVAVFKEETGRVQPCLDVVQAAQRGECQIATSALTLTEVLWGKQLPKLERTHEETIRNFFFNPYIFVVNLDRRLAEQAREFVWSFGIRPKDSIHVATALGIQADALHTFDQKLIKSSPVKNLKICEPGLRL